MQDLLDNFDQVDHDVVTEAQRAESVSIDSIAPKPSPFCPKARQDLILPGPTPQASGKRLRAKAPPSGVQSFVGEPSHQRFLLEKKTAVRKGRGSSFHDLSPLSAYVPPGKDISQCVFCVSLAMHPFFGLCLVGLAMALSCNKREWKSQYQAIPKMRS